MGQLHAVADRRLARTDRRCLAGSTAGRHSTRGAGMKRGVVFAALTVAALAAAGGAYWYVGQQQALPEGLVRTNGRLEVDRIEVAAKYPGRIAELPVQEGDVVRRGDLLARQDTSELEAQRAAIEAARDRAPQAMARAQAETAG